MFSFTSQGWIGVDLGTACAKVAQLARRGEQWILSSAVCLPRGARWSVESLAVQPPRHSTSELQAAQIGGQFSGREAAVCLPITVTPHVAVTHMGDDARSLTRAVETELRPLNFGASEVGFDAWPASHASDPPQISPHRKNVLAVTSAWADAVADDVHRIGWRCQAIDGLPLALARAAHWSAGPHRQHPLAAVDLGGTSATFAIVLDGMPVYVRQLKFAGFGQAVDIVARQFDATPAESIGLLTEHGIDPNGPSGGEAAALLSELLEPTLNELTSELTRTLNYIDSGRANLSPKRLVLFGGGASLCGIDRYLAKKLERPVAPWQLPGFVKRQTAQSPKIDCQFGVAIALSALAWGADGLQRSQEAA